MKRKKTEEQIQEAQNTSSKWENDIKKYSIKVSELAKEIGVTERTLRNYLNSGYVPKEETRNRIDACINNKKKYRDYVYQNKAEFGYSLRRIMKDAHLNQEQVAEITNMSQSEISKIINCDKKAKSLSTQEQYELLSSIYFAVKGKYGHIDIDAIGFDDFYWDLILFGLDPEEIECVEYGPEFDDPNSYIISRNLYWEFEKLDFDKQLLVLKYPYAFFEQTMEIKKNRRDDYNSYFDRCQKMREFWSMQNDKQKEFIDSLKFPEPSLEYNSDNENGYLKSVYEMSLLSLGQYRIKSIYEPRTSKENCLLFELIIKDFGLEEDSCPELFMKANFSNTDWYVWRQMLINAHNRSNTKKNVANSEDFPNSEYNNYR